MKRLLSVLWHYFIPLLMLFTALTTLVGDQNLPISKSIPIIPGEHRYAIATAFAVVGLVLAFIIRAYEKRRIRPSSGEA